MFNKEEIRILISGIDALEQNDSLFYNVVARHPEYSDLLATGLNKKSWEQTYADSNGKQKQVVAETKKNMAIVKALLYTYSDAVEQKRIRAGIDNMINDMDKLG